MMGNKGRQKYIPKRLLIEVDVIKKNYNYDNDRDAFNKIAEFVPIGIEIDNAIKSTGLFIKRKKR